MKIVSWQDKIRILLRYYAYKYRWIIFPWFIAITLIIFIISAVYFENSIVVYSTLIFIPFITGFFGYYLQELEFLENDKNKNKLYGKATDIFSSPNILDTRALLTKKRFILNSYYLVFKNPYEFERIVLENFV